ncbi:UNVERIFIED_CONTAM: hypothetical protein DES50_11937 [Williamsia faeni]
MNDGGGGGPQLNKPLAPVGFVLAGHIAGVIAAHDAALRLLPRRHQRTGQLGLMLTMVGYIFTGLYCSSGMMSIALCRN